jgi:hypothetical protein
VLLVQEFGLQFLARSKGKTFLAMLVIMELQWQRHMCFRGGCIVCFFKSWGTAAQIKAALLNSATPTSSLSGKCATGGRLNVSGF